MADAEGAGVGAGGVGAALGLGWIGAVRCGGGPGESAPAVGLSIGAVGAVGDAGGSLAHATSPAPRRTAPRSVAANSLSTAGARVVAN